MGSEPGSATAGLQEPSELLANFRREFEEMVGRSARTGQGCVSDLLPAGIEVWYCPRTGASIVTGRTDSNAHVYERVCEIVADVLYASKRQRHTTGASASVDFDYEHIQGSLPGHVQGMGDIK